MTYNHEVYKDCPLRHPGNGNCSSGGFCTAVPDMICEAARSAYSAGRLSGQREAWAYAYDSTRPENRPEIVCLCGSTRFYEAFQEANYRLTLEGKIILTVGFYMHTPQTVHGQSLGCTPEQKIQMDELHKRKIDLCDRVLVLNVGGYIGESTRGEIEYAHAHGKQISFLEAQTSAIDATRENSEEAAARDGKETK